MQYKTTDELAKILWDYNQLNSPIQKVDCVLAMGSHDLRVAQRATELMLQDTAPLLICAGGFGRLTAGEWTKPEAEMFAEVACKAGVPEEKILLEDKSTNTGENIDFSMKLLMDKGIDVKKVFLVHKPYMERRAFTTFKKHFPEIEVFATSPRVSYEDYPNETISKDEMLNIIVGDTQRIKVYPEKGYSIPQDMPDEVWQAYLELVNRGFSKQLIKE